MAQVYLAGVATAEIFDGDELIASARTLLDSSITIGVTLEDIRGGQGNALWGKFAHTSTFDLKITDAMFNLEYLAMNVGSDLSIGGDVFYYDKDVKCADGSLTLTHPAVAINSNGDGKAYAYVRSSKAHGAKMKKYEVSGEGKTVTSHDFHDGETYCVRYMYTNTSASKLTVSSNFIPATVSVILTANLYSGDACNPSTSTAVGSLTIKVPRFQLNGSQELSMSASGVSQTSFEGSALASGCSGCDDKGTYAEIIQVIDGANWYDEASSIVFEDSYVEYAHTGDFGKGFTPVLYACYDNAVPKRLSAQDIKDAGITFTKADTDTMSGLKVDSSTCALSGTLATGSQSIKAASSKKPVLDASMTIVAKA